MGRAREAHGVTSRRSELVRARPQSSGASSGVRSVVEDEGHQQVHLVLADPVVLDLDALFLDPRALDVAQRLRRPGDPLGAGILETVRRSGTDLRDPGDCHARLLVLRLACPRQPYPALAAGPAGSGAAAASATSSWSR